MNEYKFDRGWDGTRYHVENIERVDLETQPIHLSKEIEAALAGKLFKLFGAKSELNCIFESKLTTEEEATLSSVISKHKNNTQE